MPQIVGHTPPRQGEPCEPLYHQRLDSWRVDTGAALSGVVGCIVQDAPGGPWRSVTYTRGEDGTV